jgi:pre-rRNA-processing protein TSR3
MIKNYNDGDMPAPKLFVYDEKQCDPKKCTARKMLRFGLANELNSLKKIPHGAIVLNPLSKKAISGEDAERAVLHGIVVMDLSWKNIEEFPKMRKDVAQRALPLLFAANPVNWGKPQRLTSAEALGAALYIIGFKEEAKGIFEKFSWGEQFLILNKEPLERYAQAETSIGVVAIQDEYL